MRITSADRGVLNNRFFVLKNRAIKRGVPFAWPGFGEWVRDLEELLVAEGHDQVNIGSLRVEYDQGLAPGYCRENMRLVHNAKAEARTQAETCAVMKRADRLLEESHDKRTLFAMELVIGILKDDNKKTMSEIITAAARVAGMAEAEYTSPPHNKELEHE